MPDGPIYQRNGDRLVPTADAGGPWFPGVQHGGAVAGLIARAVDAQPSAAPMQVTRLTIDLFRKVPMAPTLVRVAPARDGRRIQVLDVLVEVDDTIVARASVLRIRHHDGVVPAELVPEPPAADGPLDGPESVPPTNLPEGPYDFVRCFDIRRLVEPADGVGVTWYRLTRPLVDDEPLTPLIRVAATADLSMSAGHLVGAHRYTSANPDLTIYLERPHRGAWVGLDSVVRLNEGGHGVTDTVLHDTGGRVARVAKSLLVDRR